MEVCRHTHDAGAKLRQQVAKPIERVLFARADIEPVLSKDRAPFVFEVDVGAFCFKNVNGVS